MLGGLVALGYPLSAPALGGSAGASVRLDAKEFLYEPKEVTAPVGEITFVIKNAGAIEHNFVIEDSARKKLAEIAVIEPGTTAEVRATLGPGAYTIVCTLPGHRQAGMVAALKSPSSDGSGDSIRNLASLARRAAPPSDGPPRPPRSSRSARREARLR